MPFARQFEETILASACTYSHRQREAFFFFFFFFFSHIYNNSPSLRTCILHIDTFA